MSDDVLARRLAPPTLDTPLGDVVGAAAAKAFASGLRLITVEDLLWHLPRRYAKRGELTALEELVEGEQVSIVAEVRSVTERPMRQRRGSLLEVVISDGRGLVTLTWFGQGWRQKELRPGLRGMFTGKVRVYRGQAQLAHPDYEIFPDEGLIPGSAAAKAWADTPIPVYSATAKLPTWKIREAVQAVLEVMPRIPDPVPAAVRRERHELTLDAAFRRIHNPERFGDDVAPRETFAATEAFVLQTALLAQRAAVNAVAVISRPRRPGGLLERFDSKLPFALTGDQSRIGAEISAALEGPAAMQRLVQGEVGSGKTLVALRAMLQTVESGGQSVLLAPTEVLAAQHYRSFVHELGHELVQELQPILLTGSLTQSQRRKALLRIASGGARIVIGTHAVLGERVQYADLGLVVIDEQHRFGVEQRETLRRRGGTPPHLLVLTATPIPRTVAMTVFGDLDVSTMTELPGGRRGIETYVVALGEHPTWGDRVWERIAEEVRAGRQAFVVCPAIDEREARAAEGEARAAEGEAVSVSGSEQESVPAHAMPPRSAPSTDTDEQPEAPPIAAVEAVLPMLRAHPALAKVRIEAVHGKLPAEEKDARMRAFAAREVDVIVATTVIEVGVNVPNATVMAVLDADRFGISQLHQLRGRVGRGAYAGLCLLVTHAAPETLARERVDAVAATTDGFALAEADLEQRREGDVLGARQSGGRSSLRVLRVIDHADIIGDMRQVAAQILTEDPRLEAHPELRDAVRRIDTTEREFLGAG